MQLSSQSNLLITLIEYNRLGHLAQSSRFEAIDQYVRVLIDYLEQSLWWDVIAVVIDCSDRSSCSIALIDHCDQISQSLVQSVSHSLDHHCYQFVCLFMQFSLQSNVSIVSIKYNHLGWEAIHQYIWTNIIKNNHGNHSSMQGSTQSNISFTCECNGCCSRAEQACFMMLVVGALIMNW